MNTHNSYLRKVENAAHSYNAKDISGEHLTPPLGAWFHLTSRHRIVPEVFIIGVQKGGTTSLAKYLFDHPQVIQAQRKDIYYFNNDVNYKKGQSWYRAHFAHRLYQRFHELKKGVSNSITIDATPNYFVAPGAAERLKNTFPDAKLILMLRNPIERAWSNYRMMVWHGMEKLDFEDAINAEQERIIKAESESRINGAHNFVLQRLAYRKNGCYADFLPEWTSRFKPEQLLILKSEDMFENPAAIYNRAVEFCGIESFNYMDFDNPNKGKIEKEIPSAIRFKLKGFYKPYNERLYSMLNRNFNWE